MSKFCSNCGNALEPGSKFCNNCGTPVDVSAANNQGTQNNGGAQDALNNLQQSGEKLVQDGQKLAQEGMQAVNQYIQNMQFYSPTMNDVGFVENFLSFKGRLNRLRYFKRLLILEIIFYVVELLVRELFADPFFGYLDTGGQIVFFLITMAYGASFLCLSFRRLLDIQELRNVALPITGVLALMILIIGCSANVNLEVLFDSSADTFYTIAVGVRGLAELALLVWPGMVGPNEYGPDRVVQPPQA
ncbi:MAG: DUF805 domain-containing protein [Veillonella caviae]|nr:DUF805 domain-containing protein [Veillonella caviae]